MANISPSGRADEGGDPTARSGPGGSAAGNPTARRGAGGSAEDRDPTTSRTDVDPTTVRYAGGSGDIAEDSDPTARRTDADPNVHQYADNPVSIQRQILCHVATER
ncbi:hypothetical protein OIU77_014243 [Salix suchowensis]|uniref:Uncharacterized protein n=1 Tax=Salix suchowensis TaxID=1278906 RepID=A0ABQ8ZX53_9ROSI|nr:hypothetical protein OIU77_014243 [Salix suchowensis]